MFLIGKIRNDKRATRSGVEMRRRPDGGGSKTQIHHRQRRRRGALVNISDDGDARHVGPFCRCTERHT